MTIAGVNKGVALNIVAADDIYKGLIADKIADKYPYVKTQYHELANNKNFRTNDDRLGQLQGVKLSNQLYILNSFSKRYPESTTQLKILKEHVLKMDAFCKEKGLEGFVPERCELKNDDDWRELMTFVKEKTDLKLVRIVEYNKDLQQKQKISLSLTGHRPDKLDGYNDMNTPFYQTLRQHLGAIIEDHLQQHQTVECHSGMALGADMIWAQAIVEKREQYPDRVTFIADIPNQNQAGKWTNKRDIAEWERLTKLANKVNTYGDGTQFKAELHKRNDGLIDNCDKLITVWNGDLTGGTASTVKKAQQLEKETIRVHPDDIREKAKQHTVTKQQSQKEKAPLHLSNIEKGVIFHQLSYIGKDRHGNYVDNHLDSAQIFESYPKAQIAYSSDPKKERQRDGYQLVTIEDKQLYVVNSYSQYYNGDAEKTKKQYTNMDTLTKNLLKANELATEHNLPLYVPEFTGAKKSGGDWSKIKEFIDNNCSNAVIVPETTRFVRRPNDTHQKINKQLNYDIANVKHGVIIHQVNCQNVMGSGVAKALYERHPKIKSEFHLLSKNPDYNTPEKRLGKLQLVTVNNSKSRTLYVANSFTQLYYGNALETGKRYTHAQKLKDNLKKIDEFGKKHNLPVYAPYKIGCGLAGGNWNDIGKFIKEQTDIILVGQPETTKKQTASYKNTKVYEPQTENKKIVDKHMSNLTNSSQMNIRNNTRYTENYVYFHGHQSPFSNLNLCQFVYDNHVMNCAEQAFMYEKAKHFDPSMIQTILDEKNPYTIKKLGREVKNYDPAVWDAKRYDIMVDILKAKATNDTFRQHLLQTGTATLVEGSPYDKIWGVGLAYDSNEISKPQNWKGQNLLGKALTQVRQELILEQNNAPQL